MQQVVFVHSPKLDEDGTVTAAVTLPGCTERLSVRIQSLTITDVDESWTRGFVMSEDVADSLRELSSADAALAQELEHWDGQHRHVLAYDDFKLNPSVSKAGRAHFVAFRTHAEPVDYYAGDRCDVEMELRGVQRGVDSGAYTALWRAKSVSKLEKDDEEDIVKIAAQMRYLAAKLSTIKAGLAPIAIPN